MTMKLAMMEQIVIVTGMDGWMNGWMDEWMDVKHVVSMVTRRSDSDYHGYQTVVSCLFVCEDRC